MLSPDARIVLTDFDGTFADYSVIPDAHVEAVRAARENGHVVLLCTGRSLAIIPAEAAALFDGVVSSAGARVDLDGETLVDEVYPEELGRRTVSLLLEHGVQFALEAADALYAPASAIALMRKRLAPADGSSRNADSILSAMRESEDLTRVPFAKISIWASPVPVEELAAALGPEVRALPNSVATGDAFMGELQLTAIDKADGLRLVAEHLGTDLSRTIAVGDGMNDVGMLAIAGTGVAVEGGPAELMEHADLVIPPPSGDGFAVALDRLGLI